MEPKTEIKIALDLAQYVVKQYSSLIQDIGGVVKEHAAVNLDNVDSKILLSILERHTKELVATVKKMKDM